MKTPANKGKKYPPEPLDGTEVQKLIKACSGRAPTGVRNRALIVLLWRGQLRIGEALALRPKDINLKAGTVHILHGKGNRDRTIGLDTGAMAMLQRWLDVRAKLGHTGKHPVFCTLDGGSVKDAYVRAMLPRMAKRAGIEKRCNPHSLRHSGAFDLANENVPLHLIQRQLGHASLSMTSRYISHLNPKAVIEAMKARTWEPV